MRVKPVLKWPGGKRWLAPLLGPIIQERLRNIYYEPFLGGGAIFLEVNPLRAVLSDINRDLIESLCIISKDPEGVVRTVWRYSNNRPCYEAIRRKKPRTEIGRAARFLYLNRTCWGGVYRLNQRGEFNTPFGNSHRIICRLGEVRDAALAFGVAELICLDFEAAMSRACDGDVVYCDPPYSFAGSNGFLRYNDSLFSQDDHKRLALCAREAVGRGASVIVSAMQTYDLSELYPGWWCLELTRSSRVSRRLAGRRQVTEALLFSWPPEIVGQKIHYLTVA